MSSSSFRHRAWRALAALALAAAAPLASGCNLGGDATGPSTHPAAARVAMAAQLPAASATEPLALRVTAGYVRAGGEFVTLSTQTLALTDARTQQVPITIDLAACLNDPARRGADQGRGADALCFVQLSVALLTGGRVLDTQTVGPLALRPGGTAVPDRPLALYTVSAVRVAPASGTAPAEGTPYRLELGQTLALTAAVQDAGGQPVADRPVRWASDAPSVARVDSLTGVVTPVAVGRARISATAGGRETSVGVQVVPASAAISVTAAGNGAGRITSTPAGLDCRVSAGQATGTCTYPFPGDAPVTLTAVPDVGSSFDTWGGDCTSAGGALTCTVTPSAPRAVVAAFTAFRALSVTLDGAGGGRVTGLPAGIACTRSGGANTGTCTAPYLNATRVTLTATPDSASIFSGWSGDCGPADPVCSVTLDQARAVTATFVRRTVRFTLALSGAGGGSVALGGGTACTLESSAGSATCTRQVPAFESLTLTAVPGSTSQFQGWAGPCTGTGPCTIVPGAATTVGAVFTPLPVPVAVTTGGGSAGNGTVASLPTGVNCTVVGSASSGTCSAQFPAGASVVLSAQPASGYAFGRWGGACASAGSQLTCTLPSLQAAAAVTVSFTFPSMEVRVIPTGLGSASLHLTAPFDTTCVVTVTATVVQGCQLRVPRNSAISATATRGATTANLIYGGACASPSAAACTFNALADTTLGLSLAPLLTPAADVTYGMLHGTVRLSDVDVAAVSAGAVSENTATVPPGATLRLTGAWQIGPVTDVSYCPGCIIQLYTAWIPNAAVHGAAPVNQRFWEGQTSTPTPIPGAGGTFDWTTRAPTTRGTYYVGVGETLLFSDQVDPNQSGSAGRPTASPNAAPAASFRVIVQ